MVSSSWWWWLERFAKELLVSGWNIVEREMKARHIKRGTQHRFEIFVDCSSAEDDDVVDDKFTLLCLKMLKSFFLCDFRFSFENKKKCEYFCTLFTFPSSSLSAWESDPVHKEDRGPALRSDTSQVDEEMCCFATEKKKSKGLRHWWTLNRLCALGYSCQIKWT